MADWVLAVERAYVADATRPAGWRRPTQPPIPHDPRALPAIGAVASRYLAVGTPRTLGIVIGTPDQLPLATLSIEAHATWFAPRQLRCAVLDGSRLDRLSAPLRGAAHLGEAEAFASAVTLSEALAADIVCAHVPLQLAAGKLRRGTHVNLLAGGTLDDELAKLAHVSRETPDLGRLAAGHVDGRQLDEITIFIAGDAAVAHAALVVRDGT